MEEYIGKSREFWDEEYVWSEEIALNYLQVMDYDSKKALDKIKDNSYEILKYLKGIKNFK